MPNLKTLTGWKNVQFGDCLSKMQGGGTPSKKVPEYWNGGIPWATVKDITKFNSCRTQDYISKEGLENSSTRIVQRGTMIMPTRMALGIAVFFDVDVSINQDLKALGFLENANKIFMYYWVQKNSLKIKRLGVGSTVDGISQDELKAIKILLPPLLEQNRIVSVLETWDKAIEKLQQKIDVKKQIKKGLMQKLLTGKKRLEGFSEKWETMQVKNVFSFIGTYSHSKSQMSYHNENKKLVYNIHYGDIHTKYDNYIDFNVTHVPSLSVNEELKAEKILKEGDLILADASEDYAGVGDSVEIKNIQKKICIAGLHTFALRDKNNLTVNGYRTLLFKNASVHNWLCKVATYSKVYGITKKSLENTNIVIPTKKEQEIIAKILTTADQEIEILEKKLYLFQAQKKFLLNNLITGQIRTSEKMGTKKI